MNPTTGAYKDRKVVDTAAKAMKRARKMGAKTAR
jgi:hypothetical protein